MNEEMGTLEVVERMDDLGRVDHALFDDSCEGEFTSNLEFDGNGRRLGYVWICNVCEEELIEHELVSLLVEANTLEVMSSEEKELWEQRWR